MSGKGWHLTHAELMRWMRASLWLSLGWLAMLLLGIAVGSRWLAITALAGVVCTMCVDTAAVVLRSRSRRKER